MLTLATRMVAGFGLLLLAAVGAIALVWVGGWTMWMFGLIEDPNTYLDALWTFTIDLGGWKRFAGIVGGSAVGAVLFDGIDATDLVAVTSSAHSDQDSGMGGEL